MRSLAKIGLAAITAALLAACATDGMNMHWSHDGADSRGETEPATKPDLATMLKSATTNKLDDKGYIHQWLILGPIAFADTYVADDIDKDQIKDEANLTPQAGDKQKVTTMEGDAGAAKPVQKELTWIPVSTSDYFVDFNEVLGLDDSTGMGAYAVTYLDAPEEMKDIKFSLCSNDDGKVFLNGQKVYLFVGGRGLSEDADVVDKLTLKKGVNVVIFKVWNDANNWQGCIRLLDKNDKPITNVTVLTPLNGKKFWAKPTTAPATAPK